MKPGMVVLAALVAGGPSVLAAQDEIGARLAARGAPAMLIERVRALVADAQEEGLPVGPIENKAMEGLAKRTPADRIPPVLEQVRERLRQGRVETQAAGLTPPPGAVVAAAAEALGRGMSPEAVRELIRSAPAPETAAAGLTVAASLAAQGLDHRAAVRAVHDAYARGPAPEQLFELPSVVADLTARGTRMSDVARRILEGGGLPLPPIGGEGPGKGGRPGNVPPGPGRSGQHGQGRGRVNQ
jgi:hypothetical protein